MSRYMLDTPAYSEAVHGHAEIQRVLQEAEQIHLSPIVLGELYEGFRRGALRKQNEQRLQEFLSSWRVNVPPIAEETARCYAEILSFLRSQGTPIPANDIWIAAGAMQHGLRVLTTDRHFRHVPQVLVDLYPLED